MDRTINVTVTGEFVRKDSKNAGVQGEANVTGLHIVMSDDWEAFSKRIIWRNALGESPVAVLLYNSVEDLVAKKDPLTFDTAIPAEPLALEGWCSFTIEGFRESDPTAVAITVTDHLLVKPNDAYTTPKEPTPTQAQQLQTQIDGIVPQVSTLVGNAIEALEQAEEAVRECFGGTFGDAGNTVVIEEMLTGPECSLLAFTDGKTVRPMATSQDHKRALEGDKGPNTGGMGVYSPVPIVTDEEHATMVAVMEQTVAELAAEGIDYRGCLYGGFMLTPAGPKVLEFNARFGDPETQVVLPRLKNDLVEVMLACANCELDQIELDWRDEWAVAVVLTSAGYPGSYEKGKVITGIADAEAMENVTVYHAGTAVVDGQLVTNGGRVLAVTALGDTFENARNLAYEACEKIDFEGKTLRHDIGLRALRGRDAWDA